MNNKITCKRCGCTDLQWQQSKSGKWYLAQSTPIHGEGGRHIKTIYPAHRCEIYLQRATEDAEEVRIEREKAESNKISLQEQYDIAVRAGEFVRAAIIQQVIEGKQ